MKIYFASEYPSVIKLGGLYYGILDNDIKPCKLDSGTFIEICPTTLNQPSVNFILDDAFLSNPPSSVSVTDLKGGYLIKTLKTKSNVPFGVIGQEKTANANVTIYGDNGLKISIDTGLDFFIDEYFYEVTDFKAENFTLSGKKLLSVMIFGEKNVLLVYLLENNITKIFEREVSSYDLSLGLTTTEKLKDIAKHTLTTSWGLTDNKLVKIKKDLSVLEGFSPKNLTEKIIPYAFLEEFLVGGNFSEYLSESVNKNADKLGDYLGDFIGVFPPPSFRNSEEIGLIYKLKDNLFYAEYFTFTLCNKKIDNITKCE